MDKKQVYCRYCGRLIDEDSPFCTNCGRKQNNDIKSGSIWNVMSYFSLDIYSMFPKIKFKYNRNIWMRLKKWMRRILFLMKILIAVLLMILLGYWLCVLHLVSKWNRNDVGREAIALNDISKADHIARVLFEEDENNTHSFKGLIPSKCSYSHREKALFILKDAAERGNANAQFTLGELYYSQGISACRELPYYSRDSYDETTDFDTYFNWGYHINLNSGEYIDNISEDMGKEYLKKGIYWLSNAANQGHVKALFFLGKYYNKGDGIGLKGCGIR